jgi:hypothetical protein
VLHILFHEEKGNTHQRSFIKIAEIIEQFVD